MTARAVPVAATLVAALWILPSSASAVGLGEAMEEGDAGNRAAVHAQQEIDEVSDEADQMYADYRRTIQEIDSLRLYNQQLEEVVDSQSGEVENLESQIADIDDVERKLGPLMARMIDVLDRFVELDLPFLPEERRKRMADLGDLMKRADVSLSEKYRRLMEAYQVENEYGRTIEAYRGTLDAHGKSRTVEFLRVGRVALVYQTLDMEESGRWDADRDAWVILGDEFRRPIHDGIKMAYKRTAPDLIRIPVAAPKAAR